MQSLPHRANLEHLKKQAKDLLRLYRSGDPGAIADLASTFRRLRAGQATR